MKTTEQRLFEEKLLMQKAIRLLKQSIPYIEQHFQKSRAGYGYSARDLINEIKEFITKQQANGEL